METAFAKMVKSAVRVLDIFEAFEAERRALTISELVKLLAIPQSSMSTLIRSLVTKGFVEYDGQTRRYSPSVRLAFLGNWVLGSTDTIARIHALVHALHDETGQTVLIGAESGLSLQYLSVVESPSTLRFIMHPGERRPLHRSGFGVMLMTRRKDAEIGRIVRRYNAEKLTDGEPRLTEAEVLANVKRARKQGWFSVSRNFSEAGGMVTTLLPLPRDRAALAIGVAWSTAIGPELFERLKTTLLAHVQRFANCNSG